MKKVVTVSYTHLDVYKRQVLDIVHAFEKANDIKVNYQIVERRPGDIAACYADPSYALEKLGWKAEKNLEDMCRDSYHYVKTVQENNN